MNSTLQRKNSGGLILTVFYNNDRRDWDQAVERALKRHGIRQGDCALIECVPIGLNLNKQRAKGQKTF